MKKLVNQDPYKVGMAAIAALVILSAVVTVLSTLSIGTKNYVAHMAHSAGLRPGEDVQVAGVHVGQVKSIKLDGDDVLVNFNMKSGLRLGAQTTAEIKVATLLGTHYLAIDPQGSGELKDNSIPLAQTAVPYNLQDVIDRGTAAIKELDAPLLAKALTTMADVTEAAEPNFGPALQGIARIGEVVATRTEQTGQLLEAAKNVSTQLEESSDNILSLMQQSTLVLNEISSRRAAIHSLLVKTSALAKALNTIVRTTRGDLAVALKNTRAVLKMLKGQDKLLKDALTEMAPAARYLANATGNGPWADVITPGASEIDGMVCKGQGTC